MTRDESHWPPDFDAEVRRLVEPIVAGARRKRMIEEELLAHLTEAYEEEVVLQSDARAARRAVRRRFGSAAEIGRQLQAAVPRRERVLFSWLGHMETYMARWWIAGLVVFLVVFAIAVPDSVEFSIGALSMLVGMGFVRACQTSPVWRATWPMWAGVAAIAIGPAIILPGLAKYKQTGEWTQTAGPIAVGAFILLAGLAVIVWGLAFRRKPLA
jgi:hypothetical protein